LVAKEKLGIPASRDPYCASRRCYSLIDLQWQTSTKFIECQGAV